MIEKYLIEESIWNIANIIKEDCKPFLKEFGKKPLFRGTEKKIKTIMELKPRTDRKPRDMHISVQTELNNMYKKKFGVALRSEAVFIAPKQTTALMYGNKHFFFPRGKFDYYWNPDVPDTYVTLNKINHPWMSCLNDRNYIDKYIKSINAVAYSKDDYSVLVKNTLEFLKADFINTLQKEIVDKTIKNKDGVHSDNNEMMFIVKSYYLVNYMTYPNLYDTLMV
jgi:hypothetical protein